ncbi:mitochondrial substrate carrier family protein [Striga asiatica]|uniref:Mitochondrial substrate carrier family protein n=1 Tax=Striga asiatica TaxID=4170 RepID=A0A5A7R319_STRAF|nr:mitochondrial substrate carrier family protein [Striga asiatica]
MALAHCRCAATWRRERALEVAIVVVVKEYERSFGAPDHCVHLLYIELMEPMHQSGGSEGSGSGISRPQYSPNNWRAKRQRVNFQYVIWHSTKLKVLVPCLSQTMWVSWMPGRSFYRSGPQNEERSWLRFPALSLLNLEKSLYHSFVRTSSISSAALSDQSSVPLYEIKLSSVIVTRSLVSWNTDFRTTIVADHPEEGANNVMVGFYASTPYLIEIIVSQGLSCSQIPKQIKAMARPMKAPTWILLCLTDKSKLDAQPELFIHSIPDKMNNSHAYLIGPLPNSRCLCHIPLYSYTGLKRGMSNAIVNGMAGAGGGIVAQIITYPLQTVNTRQQTERVAKENSVPPSVSRPDRSTLLHIFQVIRNEGLGGLYSGLKPSLLGTAASQDSGIDYVNCKDLRKMAVGSTLKFGIYYSFYQAFKNKAEAIAIANKRKGKGDGLPGMLSWLIVAALAGSLNVLFTNPIWVLVTRMQTQTQAERKIMEAKREALLKEASANVLSQSSLSSQLAKLDSMKPRPYGTYQAACEVYNESGIAGFWKGIIPTLIMVCNPSIQFMIYESLLKRLRTKKFANKRGSTNISAMEIVRQRVRTVVDFLAACGTHAWTSTMKIDPKVVPGAAWLLVWEVTSECAVAKLGATVCTYPLLVVKSRLQAKQEIGGNMSLRYSGDMTNTSIQFTLLEEFHVKTFYNPDMRVIGAWYPHDNSKINAHNMPISSGIPKRRTISGTDRGASEDQ